MTTLYDPQTGQSVEITDPAQAKQALLSGQLTAARKDSFSIVNSKGDFMGSVPGDNVAEKLASGDFHLTTPQQKEIINVAYSPENQGWEGAAKVAAENLANQLTFGVSGPIVKLFRTPEEQQAHEMIEQQHQTAGNLGSAAGFAGSLITGGPLVKGVGLFNIAGAAGETVAGFAPKVLQGAAKLGTEAAVLSVPAAVTELSLGHPDDAAEHLLYGLGAGAALGLTGSLLKPVLKGAGKIALNVVGKPFGYDPSADDPLKKMVGNQVIRALMYGADGPSVQQLKHVGMEDIAKFLQDNNLVKNVGEDFETYANRVKEYRDSVGKQIGAAYDELDAAGAPKVDVEELLHKIETEVIDPQRKIAVAAPRVKALEKFIEDFRKAAEYLDESGDFPGGRTPAPEGFDRAKLEEALNNAFKDKDANEIKAATDALGTKPEAKPGEASIGRELFDREATVEKGTLNVEPSELFGGNTVAGVGEKQIVAPALNKLDLDRLTKAGPFKAVEANEPAIKIKEIENLGTTKPGIAGPAIVESEDIKVLKDVYAEMSAKDKGAIADIINNKNFGRNVPQRFKDFKKGFRELSAEESKYFKEFVEAEQNKSIEALETPKAKEATPIWPGQTQPGVGDFKAGNAPGLAERVDKGWEEIANKKIPESDWTHKNWKDYFDDRPNFKREPSEEDWKAYYKERFGKTPWGKEGPPLTPEQRVFLEKQTLADAKTTAKEGLPPVKPTPEESIPPTGPMYNTAEEQAANAAGHGIHPPGSPGYIGGAGETEGPGISLGQLWKQRKAIDQKIFEEKRAVYGNPSPLHEEFLKIRKVIDQVIKERGDKAMAGEFSGPLKELNKKFRFAAAVNDVVDKSAVSEYKRRNFSLSDYLVGGFGGMMHPAGLALGFGNKFMRENGNALIAKFGNKISLFLANRAAQEAAAEVNKIPNILKDISLGERIIPRLASEAGDIKNSLSHLLGKEYKNDAKAIEHINYILTQNNMPNQIDGLLNRGAPNISLAYSNKRQGVKDYLFSKIPRNPLAPGPFQTPWQPSKKQIRDFKDIVSIVNNPYSVIDRLKDGSLNNNHIDALKTNYPGVYNQVVNKIKEYGTIHPKMPYQKKIKLSLLLGEPLDNSLINVASLQQTYQSEAPSNQTGQNESKPMAANKLKDLPGSEPTKQQRIEGLA